VSQSPALNTGASAAQSPKRWQPGTAPVAVVMLSLNEGHNMEAVFQNLAGWAQEVFIVDSFSSDDTVDVALRHGAQVVQRRFRAFGDQWNFALQLPISAPWTMKLDPDERLSDELKQSIAETLRGRDHGGISVTRRWWLMGHPLAISDEVLRIWPTGKGRFSDVLVNEHPLVDGPVVRAKGYLEHLDSPDLDHWIEKQNRYSTMEAIIAATGAALSDEARLFGTRLQRQMWLKRTFRRVPFRFFILFCYFWLWKGLWRNGWAGYASARLWTFFFFVIECKRREIEATGRVPGKRPAGPGAPDRRVAQFD
jgi:glycosyltransferase involved in cell wall biosynthesis